VSASAIAEVGWAAIWVLLSSMHLPVALNGLANFSIEAERKQQKD
jgi:hypothetical protein